MGWDRSSGVLYGAVPAIASAAIDVFTVNRGQHSKLERPQMGR